MSTFTRNRLSASRSTQPMLGLIVLINMIDKALARMFRDFK